MNDSTLIGLELEGGWKILSGFGGYSGNFAKGYIVENSETSEKGYLKLCDIERASTGDPSGFLDRIKTLIDAFHYERELIRVCVDKKLSRVVKGLDEGELTLKNQVAPYIVFEFADDIAKNLLEKVGDDFDHALSLRCVHGALAGVNQLHAAGIAHQDIKPSNILMVQNKTKIGDLGRSSKRNAIAVHDTLPVAGDPSYSPLELMYGVVAQDWNSRRFACDMYMLGGMIVFYLTNKPITSLIIDEIDNRFHPYHIAGNYEQALPHLRETMNRIYEGIAIMIPQDFRDDLMTIVKQMTDPDPAERGWPKLKGRAGNQYSLEPYISKMANLASRAEYKIKKGI